MAKNFPFYPIWNGSLNLGDTPGVFNNSAFVGLVLQLPINITYIPTNASFIELMLLTSEVEIFNNNVHPVYFDWVAGTALPAPIGEINNIEIIPNIPEYHLLRIPTNGLQTGAHTITVVVNNNTPMGLKDDFVLKAIFADNNSGVKIGA